MLSLAVLLIYGAKRQTRVAEIKMAQGLLSTHFLQLDCGGLTRRVIQRIVGSVDGLEGAIPFSRILIQVTYYGQAVVINCDPTENKLP